MRIVTNFSVTAKADANLKKEMAASPPEPGSVFALVYMFQFENADGTMVKGFRPGYQAGPWPTKHIGGRWLLARLPNGTEFYFLPRGVWDAGATYRLDTVGPLFSIESVSAR